MKPNALFAFLVILLICGGQLIAVQDFYTQGWDDVSFHGSKQIPTPNLDALAYDGVLLANYYVQPICTPTRGALMTGRHPIHTGLQRSVIVGSAPYGLGLDEKIMPQYLQELGYRTHIVGKWHLGFFNEDYTPTRRGFDSHFGYFMGMEDYWDHTTTGKWHLGFYSEQHTPTARGFESHFGYYQGMEDYFDHSYQATPTPGMWGLDFRRNEDIVKTAYGEYSTELFTQEAVDIINTHNASQPLYMYLAQQAVHSANGWQPLEAPWKYYSQLGHIKDENRRKFAAMVLALDDSVGNVTRALHDRGLLNNTIIVFSTDNGGPAAGFDWNHASNYPLRGLKATVWEGGMRGNGFIWSPLLQQSGYTSHNMMQVIDWLPSLLHAAGYDMNKLPENLDGLDMWDALSKKQTSFRTEMLHNIEDGAKQWALRVENMKLVFCEKGETPQWDKWYSPETVSIDTTPIVDYWDDTDNKSISQMGAAAEKAEAAWKASEGSQRMGQGQKEEAPAHMFTSPIRQLLQDLGRRAPEGTPFVVVCGPKPANASTNCDVSKAPCVFDIEADPCEYNNLAPSRPDLVKKLLEHVSIYNATAVPPRNKPQDPQGFPSKHGGMWVPWT